MERGEWEKGKREGKEIPAATHRFSWEASGSFCTGDHFTILLF
jgi:hypothetical protein